LAERARYLSAVRARWFWGMVAVALCGSLTSASWLSFAQAAPDASEPSFAAMGVKVSDILRSLKSARPLSLRTVGTTSLVFKLDLEGGIDAAFKPASKRHPQGYRAEVAAFRIAQALGMDNVAPAVPRSFARSQLDAWVPGFERGTYAKLAPEFLESDGQVRGVAIYWIPEMYEMGIDTADGIRQWRRWLSQRDPDGPSRDRSKLVAAQVSNMITFDFLIGNWDRWSGANAQGDDTEKHLFIRDHNVAFFEPLPATQLTKVAQRLREVERFSTALVQRLKALDGANLRLALARPDDPDGFTALMESQIAGVLDRRKTLLSYLAALIDRFGEQNVLAFP
jgi:hypothetical protein